MCVSGEGEGVLVWSWVWSWGLFFFISSGELMLGFVLSCSGACSYFDSVIQFPFFLPCCIFTLWTGHPQVVTPVSTFWHTVLDHVYMVYPKMNWATVCCWLWQSWTICQEKKGQSQETGMECVMWQRSCMFPGGRWFGPEAQLSPSLDVQQSCGLCSWKHLPKQPTENAPSLCPYAKPPGLSGARFCFLIKTKRTLC